MYIYTYVYIYIYIYREREREREERFTVPQMLIIIWGKLTHYVSSISKWLPFHMSMLIDH